ncbi:MAG: metallophosphoesterase [Oscillospiraceae bacterium]|nr:metallophosphoesterase [Oscillospiraceae bacterium]
MNSVTIERLQIPSGRRMLVTSDVHGNLSHLQNVLQKAQFSASDLLFIVGDLIEKGPQSLQTLRYVMQLCEAGNVYPLLGNVDAWRLHMIRNLSPENAQDFYEYLLSCRAWKGSSFFDEMTVELGCLCRSPEEVLRMKEPVLAHFQAEVSFLDNLPTVIETQNYIFVHGGLRERDVQENAKRGLFELLKYDRFMETPHRFEKYVVVGHWPVSLYGKEHMQLNPVIDREKKIISIDGGCGIKDFGQLNLLIIPNFDSPIDDVSFISYDDLPVFRAETPQEASTGSTLILWTDNAIQVLEKGADESRVRHLSTGRELWVPNVFLSNDARCRDYSDYALPVSAGDKLSLILKASKGCFVKKDGVIGWYYGTLEAVTE